MVNNDVITHLGFWVGLLSCLAVLLAAILALLSAVGRHLTGWNANGFKRLLAESLIDIIEESDSDARWLACYLRECVIDDEIPTGEGARRYILRARQHPDAALRGAIRYDSALGTVPVTGDRRRDH